MNLTPKEFAQSRDAYEQDRIKRCRRAGPCYCGQSSTFSPWHDQLFGEAIEPTGRVNLPQALRVGSVQNGLEIVLLADRLNEETLVFPEGATITASFLQGDNEEGPFEDVGPTICVMAPADGIYAEANHVVCRLPLPNFDKPWLMITLSFSRAISGGKLECALNLVAR